MACGVPVVATRVGAFLKSLVVQGTTGLLVDPQTISPRLEGPRHAIASVDRTRLAAWQRPGAAMSCRIFRLRAKAAGALVKIYRKLLAA